MKRIVASLLCGLGATFGMLIIAAFVVVPHDKMEIGAFLLVWPLALLKKLGLAVGCAGADSIADKMTCARIAILADLVAYPLVISSFSYVAHFFLFRFGRRPAALGTRR